MTPIGEGTGAVGRARESRSRAERIASGPELGAPAPAVSVRIGPRLRGARLAQKLSLEQLAGLTGLTKGFISQLERDMTSASVASLVRICEALHVNIGTLFEPSYTSFTTLADAPLINFGGTGLREQILTPRSQSDLQILRSEIAPGGGSGPEGYALDAKAEVVHVLTGQLEVILDDDTYHLAAGDTLSFSPRQVHSWQNPSHRTKAVVLWILAPSPW
jgi:transcriptional regulator with XRE-family HTH domain